MPKFQTEEYTAPACWASYLINGDSSGIEDYDVEQADEFIRCVELGSPVSCSEESEFLRSPDYGEPGDCLTYSFLRRVEGPDCEDEDESEGYDSPRQDKDREDFHSDG